jgi:hypothetical protein
LKNDQDPQFGFDLPLDPGPKPLNVNESATGPVKLRTVIAPNRSRSPRAKGLRDSVTEGEMISMLKTKSKGSQQKGK